LIDRLLRRCFTFRERTDALLSLLFLPRLQRRYGTRQNDTNARSHGYQQVEGSFEEDDSHRCVSLSSFPAAFPSLTFEHPFSIRPNALLEQWKTEIVSLRTLLMSIRRTDLIASWSADLLSLEGNENDSWHFPRPDLPRYQEIGALSSRSDNFFYLALCGC